MQVAATYALVLTLIAEDQVAIVIIGGNQTVEICSWLVVRRMKLN
jgi:hypothetical protein